MSPEESRHERNRIGDVMVRAFIVLAHCPCVDMSLHSDTLFWFWANQYLLFLLNTVCLAEKQQIPIS
jgi:hypothetical protein